MEKVEVKWYKRKRQQSDGGNGVNEGKGGEGIVRSLRNDK